MSDSSPTLQSYLTSEWSLVRTRRGRVAQECSNRRSGAGARCRKIDLTITGKAFRHEHTAVVLTVGRSRHLFEVRSPPCHCYFTSTGALWAPNAFLFRHTARVEFTSFNLDLQRPVTSRTPLGNLNLLNLPCTCTSAAGFLDSSSPAAGLTRHHLWLGINSKVEPTRFGLGSCAYTTIALIYFTASTTTFWTQIHMSLLSRADLSCHPVRIRPDMPSGTPDHGAI